MKFKKGDIVHLSKIGRHIWEHDSNNPHNCTGVIEKTSLSGRYIVRWSNSGANGYASNEIELLHTGAKRVHPKPKRKTISKKVIYKMMMRANNAAFKRGNDGILFNEDEMINQLDTIWKEVLDGV